MADFLEHLRAGVGRRRHRYLDAAMRRRDERISTIEASASARLAAVEHDVGWKAPALWNDLNRDLEPALPRAETLFAEAGADPASVATEKVALIAEAQRRVLESFGTEKILEHARADENPLPDPGDREMYYGDDHLAYWVSGLGDALWLEAIAERHGAQLAGGRLLDFGCASGRVLRHAAARGHAHDVVGVDIQPQAVRWARAHMTGVTIALTTVIPALPLPDRSVDVIYAGSVFTHIDDFEEATLLELRRVLKPDGIAVITVHPGRIWEDMAASDDHLVRRVVTGVPHRVDPPGVQPITPEVFAQPLPGERVVFTVLDWPVNNTNVIHTHDYLRRHWGAMFLIEEIIERAHGDHQDAVILRPR